MDKNNKQEKKEFAEFLQKLSESLPSARSITTDLIDFYFECLLDVSLAQIKENATIFFRDNGKFFPAISELRYQEKAHQIHKYIEEPGVAASREEVKKIMAGTYDKEDDAVKKDREHLEKFCEKMQQFKASSKIKGLWN
jgi:hypothetical protein